MFVFTHLRALCAVEIQRWWRGKRIKLLLSLKSERSVVLRWRWGNKSISGVSVAGDFSNWEPWRMRFVPGVEEHRISVPVRALCNSDRLQYKFVVDGLWTCDGSLPMMEDDSGNLNNVFHVRRKDSARLLKADHRREITRSLSQSTGLFGTKVPVSANSIKLCEKLPPPSVAFQDI